MNILFNWVGRTVSVLRLGEEFGGPDRSSSLDRRAACPQATERRPILFRLIGDRSSLRLRPTRKQPCLIPLLALLLVSTSWGQRALTDIPDPDPEFQQSLMVPAEGFEISLFASEPMIDKPLAISFDGQGRLWVASTTTYPQIKPGEVASDKVYRLEDTDGDGVADESKVFVDNLLIPTAILATPEGIYVGNSTDLMFYEDKDDDGVADNEEVFLSGFGTEDTHHIIHTLRAGPAGRIYFNQSIYIHSYVETPRGLRELKAGGVWRLRPETLELDIFNHGLVNSWGLQFDKWGQVFQSDGAGSEGINYAFPGAAFRTNVGVDRFMDGLNPGQPKLSGLEIIQSSQFPDEWQGRLIVCDFRGNRISSFKVEDSQSGVVSLQKQDLVTSTHGAFRPIDVQLGPDGALYVADWYNPIIQHGEVDFRDERRDESRGRIWRIAAKDRPFVKVPEFKESSIKELLDLLKAPESWTRTQAKLELKARDARVVSRELQSWLATLEPENEEIDHHRLEALWLMQAIRGVDMKLVDTLLQSEDFNVRAATVRVLEENPKDNEDALEVFEWTIGDEHPRVRLETLHALRALGGSRSAKLAMKAYSESMDDTFEFGLWRTMEALEEDWLPEAKKDPSFFGEDARKLVYAIGCLNKPDALSPLVAHWEAGSVSEAATLPALELMGELGDDSVLEIVFAAAAEVDRAGRPGGPAILDALLRASEAGNRSPKIARSDIEALLGSAREAVRSRTAKLAGSWNVSSVAGRLERIAADLETGPELAEAAVEGLALMDAEAADAALKRLASDRTPSTIRLRAIAGYARSSPDSVAMLAAEGLAIAQESDDPLPLIRPYLTRAKLANQLASSLRGKRMDTEVATKALRLLGSAPVDTSELKRAIEDAAGIEPVDQALDADEMAEFIAFTQTNGNARRGEEVYRRDALLCYTCHAIGGSGGSLGPDLTSLGASAPMDYIVDSLLQPQKKIKEGYHVVSVSLKDGSVISGTLSKEDSQSITVRDASDRSLVISKSDVASQTISPVSLMPPGLTASLRKDELADMVAFLSELGKEGSYKVSSGRIVRTFRYLHDQDGDSGFADLLRHKPFGYVTSEDPMFEWRPLYTKVDGALPLDGIPALRQHGRTRMHYLRFQIDILTAGAVGLSVSGPEESVLWAGDKMVERKNDIYAFDAERGSQTITLAIQEDLPNKSKLSIEIVDIEGSSAQAQVINGK